MAYPNGPAYFTSRGSALGQVPGEVVAAAFGVFNPEVVVPAVAYGWTLTDAPTIAEERLLGATEQLRRLLGDEPEGVGRATELLMLGDTIDAETADRYGLVSQLTDDLDGACAALARRLADGPTLGLQQTKALIT